MAKGGKIFLYLSRIGSILFFLIGIGTPRQAAQTTPPAIYPSGVVNAADYTPELAPGMWMAIFGSNLAPRQVLADRVPLPDVLEGVSVEVVDASRTIRAPLWFVAPGQINALLPYDVSGPLVQIRVRTASGSTSPVSVPVRPYLPRLFTKAMDGKGEPLLLHARGDRYVLVSEEDPGLPGEILVLYLTGLGPVTPVPARGAPAGDDRDLGPLNLCDQTPDIWVGGNRAEVLWCGLAPGWVGLYQVNLRMPRFLPDGRHEVVVQLEGAVSQGDVRVAGGTNSWREVAVTTIGSGGGTLSAGGIRIGVPAGAFRQEQRLAVAASIQSVPPRGNLATSIWRISELPTEFSAPLTISLPLASSAPAGEGIILMKVGSDRDAGLIRLRASVADGRLEAALPATAPLENQLSSVTVAPAATSAGEDEGPRQAFIIPKFVTATLWGMAGFRNEHSPNRKFVVWYPLGDNRDYEAAIDAGRILEEALGKLKAIGIDTDGKRRTPIDVYLFRFSDLPGQMMVLDDEVHGMTESEVWGRDDMGLQLNLNAYYRSREEFRTTVGHELFHIFQSYYDPRRWAQRTFSGASWLWMWEAASTWFEQKMSSAGRNYLSDNTRANAKFLFQGGLEQLPGVASPLTGTAAVRRHGYGAAVFLGYFTRGNDNVTGDLIKLSEESTGLIFKDFLNSPVDALYRKDVLLKDRWVDFCQEYVEGRVHPAIDLKLLRTGGRTGQSAVAGSTFTAGSPSKFTFRWDAPDLSAAQYEIRFEAAKLNWAPGTTLVLRLRDPNHKAVGLVYRLSGATHALMQRFTEEYRIADAATVARSNPYLYILLVNPRAERPYTGQTQIELEAEVLSAIPPFRRVTVTVKNRTRISFFDATWDNFRGRAFQAVPGTACDLQWNAPAFQASCRGDFGNQETTAVQTKGALTADGSRLVSLEMSWTYTTYMARQTGSGQISVRDLPSLASSGGTIPTLRFGLTGNADLIRQHLTGWQPVSSEANDTFALEVEFDTLR